jgi:hypothetical protein
MDRLLFVQGPASPRFDATQITCPCARIVTASAGHRLCDPDTQERKVGQKVLTQPRCALEHLRISASGAKIE